MKRAHPLITHGLAAFGAALLLGTSWQRGYLPARDRYVRDHRQAVALAGRLSEVETMVQAQGLSAWLVDHRQRLYRLQARLPDQARLPELLNALADTWKAGGVTLLNVEQGNLEPIPDVVVPPALSGTAYYRLPVTLTAEGRYQVMVTTIDRMMSESFPGVVSVSQLDVRLKDPDGTRLSATLHLYLYVAKSTPRS